jgi:amino acid transporter
MAGCFDCMESIVYVATSAVTVGSMMCTMFGTSQHYQPLFWLIFYLSAVTIQSFGNKSFWRTNFVLAWISIFVVAIFVLGGLKYVDFDKYAALDERSGTKKWFAGDTSDFMYIFPLPAWFFVGTEYINIAAQDVEMPKTLMPKAYLACIGTLIITCILVFFVSVSVPTGLSDLSETLLVFNGVFMRLFSISDAAATALSFPATYATAFGFMFCYGRQLRSMGNSGLINPVFGKSLPKYRTPLNGLLLGSSIGYGLCLLVYYVPNTAAYLFNICMLMATSMYIFQFISYFVLKTSLKNIKREFDSPLGMFGAVYGSVVFGVMMISIMFFQEDDYVALISFLVFIAVSTIYYYTVVIHRQYFSKEEKEVLFTAHLAKSEFISG